MAFPQAITDHLNQLDQIKQDDDAARAAQSDLDAKAAAALNAQSAQVIVVKGKDDQLSQAAADVVTLIQTYYKPGGALS